jgi:hypothetical protein
VHSLGVLTDNKIFAYIFLTALRETQKYVKKTVHEEFNGVASAGFRGSERNREKGCVILGIYPEENCGGSLLRLPCCLCRGVVSNVI